jgi:hypothetical protein
MELINKFISEKLEINEKLIINKNTKIEKKEFTDEELRDDYQEVGTAYTKKEKEVFCEKYGLNTTKIRDIQIAILNELRENRKKKNVYKNSDVIDFIRYDISNVPVKFNSYLDEEPKEFVKKILEYYEDKSSKRINRRFTGLSANDKYILKRIDLLKNYLGIK